VVVVVTGVAVVQALLGKVMLVELLQMAALEVQVAAVEPGLRVLMEALALQMQAPEELA
jgi:hypothetical protein